MRSNGLRKHGFLGAIMSKFLKRAGIAVLVVVALLGIGFMVIHRGPIPYATLEARYASPASRWMDLPGGVRVHYRDEGKRDGSVLVLVHGFSDSTATWNGWIERLGGDYRIISLDLPGHGLTRAPPTYEGGSAAYAELVAQVASRLGAPRFAIAGNSMGGGVAWTLALKHPERLTALVLVDAAGWPERSASGKTPLAFQLLRTEWGRQLLSQIDLKPIIAEGMKKAFYDPAKADASIVERFADMSRAPDHAAVIMRMQTAPRTPATVAQLATIHIPTLVMHGEGDNLIPADNGRRFAAAIPGAKLIIYPRVGHTPQMEIPERSAADLAAFLKTNGLGPRQ